MQEIMEKNINSVISKINQAEKESASAENKERNREDIKRLKKHIERIYESVKEYGDTYDFVNPSGRIKDGRRLSYREEMEIFKKEIKNNPDYNPIFTYPKIEKLKEEHLKEKIKSLKKIREQINCGEENEHVKKIAVEYLNTSLAKINFLLSVKNKDDKKAYKYSAESYGDIDSALVLRADEFYKRKLEDNNACRNPLRKKLKEIKLSSEDLKEFFQMAKRVLKIDGFNIELRKDEESISISGKEKIKIPEGKNYQADRVIALCSHEICSHVVAMENSKKAGFPGIYAGKNASAFQEGIAMYAEQKTEEHIFGDYLRNDKDWFIYAMNCRKKKNGFGRIYLALKKRIKEQFLFQGFDKNRAEEKAEEKALMVCRRIFRGMSDLSSKSNYYYTKDAIYFKGYIESKKMVEKGLDHYLTDIRVDPYLIPYFLSLRAIPEKSLIANRRVMEAMWDKKDSFMKDYLIDNDWYRKNTMIDRHFAYRKEFGQIDREINGIRKEMSKKK